MFCRDVMKQPALYLSPNETAVAAAQTMRDHNVGFLPICDDSMRVLGTITDRDIAVRLVADRRPSRTPVWELMTNEVVACGPHDDITTAEELMAEHRKSRIMCLDDDGRLLGVISLSDIAQCERGARAAVTMRMVTHREAHADASHRNGPNGAPV
jgi:CBS domain-containing protein